MKQEQSDIAVGVMWGILWALAILFFIALVVGSLGALVLWYVNG